MIELAAINGILEVLCPSTQMNLRAVAAHLISNAPVEIDCLAARC